MTRKYHIDFVYNAIREHKEDIYIDLFWKLWREENRITTDVLYFLQEKNSIKTIEYAKQNLPQLHDVFLANIGVNSNDWGAEESLINAIFNLMLHVDSASVIKVINDNIRDIDVHLFHIFINKAIELKDTIFIEPLFSRLEIEWNAHVYLEIVKALISFQDEKINDRIIETRKINENLNKDWGSKELDKILRNMYSPK